MSNATQTKMLPPANDAGFRGYYLREDAQWESLGCASTEAFYTMRNYGLCCPTNEPDCHTAMVTSCAGNNPVATATYTCGDGQACRSVLIYDQFPATTGAATTNVVCAEPAWSVGIMYRTVPNPLIPSTATSSVTSTASKAASQSSPNSTSKAWIAGAVLGPIIALALILGLGLWILKLKRRLAHIDANPPSYPPPSQDHYHEIESPHPHHQYVSELPVKYENELPVSTKHDAELPATVHRD